MDISIGFIGFGEAGYHIAKGLREAGVPSICAYDAARGDPTRRVTIEMRAGVADVVLVESLDELARRSEIIMSTVVSSTALTVAEAAAPLLSGRHFYMDLNSTSPEVKQEIADIIVACGARFVEAAVMALEETTSLDGFVDAWLAAGNDPQGGATELRPDGDVRIDYVFVSTVLADAVRAARVDVEAQGSDHQPLWVEIEL